jgi:meso-butanediol dehydrogenase/(S,S)-butanediol dehydrogenase/diacetyl reductase
MTDQARPGMADRVAVVTGAASGIGLAVTELFAGRGFRVVAVDVDADGLTGLSTHAGVVTLAGDVATEDANVAAVELALDRFGRLDAAVLNAGIGGGGPLEAAGRLSPPRRCPGSAPIPVPGLTPHPRRR